MLAELVLALAGCCAPAHAEAPVAPVRTVPCEEVIDHVRFPYLGNRDLRYRARLVLDAVSAPGPFVPQTTPTESSRGRTSRSGGWSCGAEPARPSP